MKIHSLKYSNTNTYLIEGDGGRLLFDTGWAGTFPAFCAALGELKVTLQSIDYILISHYHPDHMGIAQEIADHGPVLLVPDIQEEYLHASDQVFIKEKNRAFIPIRDKKIRKIDMDQSSEILSEIGLAGRIIHTPGHSDDSISLYLDSGDLFVGDLNPLYELELHKGTQIEESWNKLLELKPERIYYGHAKTATISDTAKYNSNAAGDRILSSSTGTTTDTQNPDLHALTASIIELIDKGWDISKIRKKTGADEQFIQDVMRMYLTHQNISIQGILDRIEIKGR